MSVSLLFVWGTPPKSVLVVIVELKKSNRLQAG